MTFNPHLHHRQSIRLPRYDYTQSNAYFVTICTYQKQCVFGEVTEEGEMKVNEFGNIVESVWNDLACHYPHVQCDVLIVMPNHIHGVIFLIDAPVGAGFKPAPTRHGLSEIVRALKTFSARRINESRQTPGIPVWQRNYYEHVIRSDDALHSIRVYIRDNPQKWTLDPENPLCKAKVKQFF